MRVRGVDAQRHVERPRAARTVVERVGDGRPLDGRAFERYGFDHVERLAVLDLLGHDQLGADVFGTEVGHVDLDLEGVVLPDKHRFAVDLRLLDLDDAHLVPRGRDPAFP